MRRIYFQYIQMQGQLLVEGPPCNIACFWVEIWYHGWVKSQYSCKIKYQQPPDNQALSHQVGSATWVTQFHSSLTESMSIMKPIVSKSFLLVSRIAFLALPLPLVVMFASIWSTLLNTESTCRVYTCSNHLSGESSILPIVGATATPTLSNDIIINRILFILSIHPFQHSHLCYMKSILVLAFSCDTILMLAFSCHTLCPIQHCR